MKIAIILALAILPACTTVNCSLQSGERNNIKASSDQSPPTQTDANVSLIPK